MLRRKGRAVEEINLTSGAAVRWESAHEAARALGITDTAIRNRINRGAKFHVAAGEIMYKWVSK